MLHCKHWSRPSSKVQWDSKVWWSCKSLMVCNKVKIYHEQSMHLVTRFFNHLYSVRVYIKQFVFDYQYNDNHCRCQCRIKPIISRQRRQRDNLYICQAEELSPIDIYWGACKVSGWPIHFVITWLGASSRRLMPLKQIFFSGIHTEKTCHKSKQFE